MSHASTLAALRRLMAERCPVAPARESRVIATGIASIDDRLNGGLASRTFTELVSAAPSCGGQLVTGALLRTTRQARQRLALLDACDCFCADQLSDELMAHVVWFRGARPSLFWQATDLVVRDPNFAVVVLDLRGLTEREVRRTPATTWYRLQRAIEQSEVAVLVQTEFPVVPCATIRLVLAKPMTLSAFKTERNELIAALAPEIQIQRAHGKLAG